jgi:hypothetical protein
MPSLRQRQRREPEILIFAISRPIVAIDARAHFLLKQLQRKVRWQKKERK